MSETNTVSPLRQRMIEDMAGRKLNPHTQRSHVYSCKRFAAWLKRSPDTATPDEVRGFQLYLIESGSSICNRNRIMTGVRFLFRVTLQRPIEMPGALSRSHLHSHMSVVSRWQPAHNRPRRQHQIPIALAAQPAPNSPRLRALALFGRRPLQRVVSLVIPASKNLHKSRHYPAP